MTGEAIKQAGEAIKSADPTASGCAVQPTISHKARTISVNGTLISRAAIGRETQNHPAQKPIDAWQAAARALVVRELLLQEAQRLALKPDPQSDTAGRRETDEEALIRQVVAQEVRVPTATEAECRRYFAQNQQKFVSPALYEVAHILLSAAPDDPVTRAQALQHAHMLIMQVQQMPDSFAPLAAQVSVCPSAKNGGSLGQIGPGQTVPEFEAALAGLPIGVVAPHPVESRYGVHIVQVARCIEARALPFELVQARIAHWLEEGVHRKAIRHYLLALAGRAHIEGITLSGSPSPLMQ